MIAQAVNLLNFLKGPKQFIIPIYRRTYSWRLKECWQPPISVLLAAFDRVFEGSQKSLDIICVPKVVRKTSDENS